MDILENELKDIRGEIYIFSIQNCVLFGILTVFNTYFYLVKHILKLQNRSFHLMMFALIEYALISVLLSSGA